MDDSAPSTPQLEPPPPPSQSPARRWALPAAVGTATALVTALVVVASGLARVGLEGSGIPALQVQGGSLSSGSEPVVEEVREYGYLALATPLSGLELYVNGLGSGWPIGLLKLEAGEHRLRFEAADYLAWEGRLRLAAGETRALFVEAAGSALNVEPADPSGGLAVMIDNLDAARPQIGLSRADVVYEALVEGGITRLLALFLTQEADTLGPVRSARDYFVHWASEYQAPLVHIGASPQGYNAIAATRLPTVDGRAIQRSSSRPAPHNAFASTARARNALVSRSRASFGGLHFKLDLAPHDGPAASGATIPYSLGSYRVHWSYDADRNDYARSINGKPHTDGESGEQLRAANVLVVFMNSWLLEEGNGRLAFSQTGSGPLRALVDGVVVQGSWKRSTLRAVTEYLDDAGQPLLLNPGPTWIQVVPPQARVETED